MQIRMCSRALKCVLAAIILSCPGAWAADPSLDALEKRINALEASLKAPSAVPIGSVVAFAGTTPPEGWRLCIGEKVTVPEYPELFIAIHYAFGKGDVEHEFYLPDFRGRFLRGVDMGSHRDNGLKFREAMHEGGNEGDQVGSVEEDALEAHSHSSSASTETVTVQPALFGVSVYSPGGAVFSSEATVDGRTSRTGSGLETRPKNAYVQWIIRVK